MKIVVLGLRGFPGVQGGVETHCEHLYPRIAAMGHDVVVMCRKPYVTYSDPIYRGVRLVALACPKSRSLEAFFHTFSATIAAWRLKPDVVHIHAIGPALLVPLARLLGLRVVYTNHGPDYDRQKWGRAARVLLKLGEAWGTRFSHGTVAISRPIADHLRRAFRHDAVVIPNGVVIQSRATTATAVMQLGLEPGRYVLGVGRLVPEKGFHDLVDAFRLAAPDGWKLAIVGRADHEGDYSVRLREQAARTPNVVMAGFMSGEPLRELYSHAGVFALPSYHEGLPIVLLEAMSYGLPVVASDIPGNRQAGLGADRFFAAGDTAQAAASIALAASNPLPDAAREEQIDGIRRDFDWDNIALRTLELYAQVTTNKVPVSRTTTLDPTERQ